MMHTLTVKLKQHTPLIHFQHDQEGATLRASEVKPKIDKFLLVHMSPDEINDGLKEGWIVEHEGRRSFRYKMSVSLTSDKRKEYLVASYVKKERIENMRKFGISVISNSPYFAQEKQNGYICKQSVISPAIGAWNSIEKKGILFNSLLKLTIICTQKTLADLIVRYIQAFFLSTNFGSRQSKGFGSFTVESILYDDLESYLGKNIDLLCQNFTFVYRKINVPPNISIDSIFSQINDDYRLLKSGRRTPYAHSKLMLYEKKHGIRWEKKYIKMNFMSAPFKDENNCDYQLQSTHCEDKYNDKGEYRFVRVVLGLSGQYEFLLKNKKDRKLVVKIENKNIERFVSPLLFKVIDGNIYIVGNEVNPDILDQPFQFVCSIQNYAGSYSMGDLRTLSKFSLSDFMADAVNDTSDGVKLNYKRIR